MPFDPLNLDSLTYNGIELRRAAALGVQGDGTALGARSGVRPGDSGLTTTLSGSTITVSAGAAWVAYSGQGVYRAALPSAWTGALTAAHATLPRIDLVYLRVWDTDVDASGLRQADVVYLEGAAAATPSAPTPVGTQIYMPLATISVPASGAGSPSVNLAARPVAVAPGGIVPDPAAPGVYAGQYRDSNGGLERYDGTAWWRVTPYRPTITLQTAAQPPFDVLNTFVDFVSGTWAPVTVTVPPSGLVEVIIAGDLRNTNSTASTCYLAWRMSGAFTITASSYNQLLVYGGWLATSRTRLVAGLPTGTITITPQWRISSGSSSTASIQGGELIVRPLP